MAKKPEAVFSRHVIAMLPGFDIVRVETVASLGFPDMVLTDKGGTGKVCFLENKVVSRGLKVGLRPHQVSFLFRQWSYGASAYILVKHVPAGKRVGKICLYEGGQAMALSEKGLSLDPVLLFSTAAVDWQQIREKLLSKNST